MTLWRTAGANAVTSYMTRRYDPFGAMLVSSGVPSDLRFPGQWFQAESGLHQNWMRDYDPTTGRYLEPDPLGLVDGASVYGYALQNPGRYVDPRGLQSSPIPGLPQGPGMYPMLPSACSCVKPDSFPEGYSYMANRSVAATVGSVLPMPLCMGWFYQKVRNSGPWDYKQADRRYENAGNWNYGATGNALGIPLSVLLLGAGWASGRSGNDIPPEWGRWNVPNDGGNGDDPKDQWWIRYGYLYDRCGCGGE